MPIDFLAPVDVHGLEVLNLRLQNLAAAPGDPTEGRVYFDTTLSQARIYRSGAWQNMAGNEGTVTSVGGTAPIASTGGTEPTISIAPATTSSPGSLSAADKLQLDGLQAALDATEKTANKDQANGYPGLDGGGKIASAALPALAITDTFVVASEAAMLGLTAEVGDVAVRTDEARSYILQASPASTLGNWQELLSPTDGVTEVTGAAPITSSGGATPAIGLAAGGVGTGHLADQAVTSAKLAATVAGDGLTGGNGTPLALDAAVATRKFSVDLGAATSSTVTHNLGTRDVQVTVRETATPWAQVVCDVEMTTLNSVTIRFAVAPAAGAYRATVVG